MAIFFNGSSSAQQRVISNEKQLLIASNHADVSVNRTAKVKIIIPANVEYPEILEDHMEESKEYIKKYSKSHRDHLIRIFDKGKKLLPKVAGMLKKSGLPQEFRMMVALESGFNPTAKSGAGAYGYWQFMDASAKEYGLNIADKSSAKPKDDRTNLVKSTHAAVKYLKDRGRNLNNDVLLMVASYNCGVGKVYQAIRKTGKTDPSFWDVKRFLPSETRAYVMNFIAVNVIFNNYEKFMKDNLQFEDSEIEKLVNLNGPEENTVL